MVVDGAGIHSNGELEAQGPGAGGTLEGMVVVVRKRPGVGVEVCRLTLPPPAATTTPDIRLTSPARQAISRRCMLLTLERGAIIATSWDMCTNTALLG